MSLIQILILGIDSTYNVRSYFVSVSPLLTQATHSLKAHITLKTQNIIQNSQENTFFNKIFSS